MRPGTLAQKKVVKMNIMTRKLTDLKQIHNFTNFSRFYYFQDLRFKLREGDLSIPIGICFSQHLQPVITLDAIVATATEDRLQFADSDKIVTILVKQFKCGLDVLFFGCNVLLHGGHREFFIAYHTVLVCIDTLEQFSAHEAANLRETLFELLRRDIAILRFVQLNEQLLKLVQIGIWGEHSGDQAHNCRLESIVFRELQNVADLVCCKLVVFQFLVLCYERGVQECGRRGSI